MSNIGTTIFMVENNTGATSIIIIVCADDAVSFVFVLDSDQRGMSGMGGMCSEGGMASGTNVMLSWATCILPIFRCIPYHGIGRWNWV